MFRRRNTTDDLTPIRVEVDAIRWDGTWTLPDSVSYLDSRIGMSWLGPDGPWPLSMTALHWKNRVHRECIRRVTTLDMQAVSAMAHLLDPTTAPVRSVLRSWGKDFTDDRARIIAAQVFALAAVDDDLGLPAGMSHPVVYGNVRHLARTASQAMAPAGREMVALTYWMIATLYFQMRWDTPEYTVPLILDQANPDASPDIDPSEEHDQAARNGQDIPPGETLHRPPAKRRYRR